MKKIIEKELHIIPYNGNYIIFSPKTGSALLTNKNLALMIRDILKGHAKYSELEKYPDIVKELKRIKFIRDDSFVDDTVSSNLFADPTSVTIFPTHNCNLKCIYCYASAGEVKKDLNIVIAKSAIDLIIKNSIKNNNKKVRLSFHGGGEPFCAFALMKESVRYAQKICENNKIKLTIDTATNGVLTDEMLNWINNNKITVQVSLDGPQDIHNMNRPRIDGSGSFNSVINTINFFEKEKIQYNIRSTITALSLGRMSEIVSFLLNISSNKVFYIEPLFECGRCKNSGEKEPDPDDFIREFVKARKIAKKQNRDINFSAIPISIRSYFCGAVRGNFCITPEGNVTSCYEVDKLEDIRSDVFFYGKYNNLSVGKFEFFNDKFEFLSKRNVGNISFCSDCIAKYSCAGDCPSKLKNIFDTSENRNRCKIFKELTLLEIIDKVRNEEVRQC